MKFRLPFVLIAFGLAATPASAGVLDSVGSTFAGSTGPIQAKAATWAMVIFVSIVSLEFLATAYDSVRTNGNFYELTSLWWQRVIGYMLGLYAINNAVSITQWVLAKMADIATDFAGGGAGGVMLSPDGIAYIGWTVSDALLRAKSGNLVVDVAAGLPQAGAAFLVQVAFLFVACEDLAVNLGVQFVVSVGGISLGMCATRWTRHIAAAWGRMMWMGLLLLVTVNAVASVGTVVAANLTALITQAGGESLSGVITTYVTIGASSLVYLFFALAIPSLAGFLGATSPMHGGAALSTVIAAGASFIAGSNAGARGAGAGGAAGSGSAAAAKESIASIEAATRVAA